MVRLGAGEGNLLAIDLFDRLRRFYHKFNYAYVDAAFRETWLVEFNGRFKLLETIEQI